MKETPPASTYADRFRSWARTKAHGGHHNSSKRPIPNLLPISEPKSVCNTNNNSNSNSNDDNNNNHNNNEVLSTPSGGVGSATSTQRAGADAVDGGSQLPTALPQNPGPGPVVAPGGPPKHPEPTQKKPSFVQRFWANIMKILFRTKLNALLVFVPVGIAVKQVPGLNPAVVFAMNAMAIVPLAGLLAHATESVARKMGDTVGALLNVTFGNAVELIIFIALVKGQIRIVQASLLGSILANLLLILGMAFFLGGLRYREQLYNSTVSQTSACLLSLSVISLVLPTAFHASFSNTAVADEQSLKISRGTSVILLLVYVLYLFFQLKSHAYMYQSTPQHIIDEEATPGPAAGWLDSSSSDGSSSDSSDSDYSGRSRETLSRRVRRAIRATRHRKPSFMSMETGEGMMPTRSSSFGTADASPAEAVSEASLTRPGLPYHAHSNEGTEEAVDDEKSRRHGRKHRRSRKKHRKSKRRHHHSASQEFMEHETIQENPEVQTKAADFGGEPRCVDFAATGEPRQPEGVVEGAPARRPFTALRGIALGPVAKTLALTVFSPPPQGTVPAPPVGPVPRVRYGIRRINSLPNIHGGCYTGAMMPSQIPLIRPPTALAAAEIKTHEYDLSKAAAVILLLCSTGVVALCAEYMVDSINGLVETSGIKDIFIGLIVLPIIGNAAEHVTAVTVAMKNKMDLAIGVAVGSSIQIALFITPLIVIIGWAMGQNMTLYFTLFETVALFVSTFIVNFLVLDGRSNYMEGALLCATYVIIGTAAFFYPNTNEASSLGAP